MDLAVRFLHRGCLDNAIQWFHRAAAHDYPGAQEVRNAVANLRDTLQVTTTERYNQDPIEQLLLHPRAQASAQAVTHSLVRAARLAITHLRSTAPTQSEVPDGGPTPRTCREEDSP